MGGLSLTVMVSGVQAPVYADPTGPAGAAASSGASVSWSVEKAGELSRPDAVSAMVTARATGRRVEDLSQRTELTSTWANPDGTWTMEGRTGIQRFRDSDGDWVDVDLDLGKEADGSVVPGGHPLGLRLPGAGRGGAISIDEGKGRTVSLHVPGVLPAPELDGSRATYSGVSPGVDMVVESLRSGYEQFFVLNERPTGPVSWDLPLLTRGLTAQAARDGGVEFVDAKGKVVSRIPAAIAWDAQVDDATGEPVSTSPVRLTVTQRNPGRAILSVTPDAKWLADPATVFPVTVDPTYASGTRYTTFDTFVQQGYSTGQSGSTELKLGNNGSGQVARSFLEFQLGTLKGKKIMSASLKLRATHSWSCSTRYWEAWKVGSDVSSSTVWSNQPAWETQYGSSNQTRGYSSSCPDGEVSINIKSLVQSWADSSLTTNRLGLRAANESDEYGWKKFASSETANDPYISITYNRVPAAPGAPTLAPVATYNSAKYTSDTTPAFTSKATDADGNSVKLTFEVHNSTTVSSTSLKSSCTASAASGANATCSPGTVLADNATYYVRARANDSLQDGAWSAWTTFKVAAGTPAAPAITCTGYADGSWTEEVPTASVPCRISATGTGTNAPGYIKYSVDGGAVQRVQITQSTDPAVAKVDLTISNKAGGHRISAWAESPSGKVSSPEKKYAFGYGRVGIDTPETDPMPVTTGALAITASGPPASAGTTATAELKWRLASSGGGEGTGWNTAKTLNVATDATTGGLAISGTWDTMLADVDAQANGGIGIELDDRVPATLELQVCVTYSAGVQCTWNSGPLRVLRVPHAFGDGFPVADTGPGQVALWTGEFTTSATDVSVPGYVGDLSISRTHSTYAGAPSAAAGVFGPGWTASFDGPDTGLAGYELVDNTQRDGTLLLLSPKGDPMVFAPGSGWVRRTGANLATGEWIAVDDATADLGLAAKLTGTATATTFAITTPDNVTTTFRATTAPGTASPAVFAPESVAEAGLATATSYAKDPAGRITRILAPIPTGMTGTDCPLTGTLQPGCRALDITYATATTATGATPGDIAGQVKRIDLHIYNPDKTGGAGMDTIPVAEYAYNIDKRLVSVTDPRVNLTRAYGYDASGRLVSMTDPGLTPYQLEYSGTPAQLARVKRDRPASAGGGTATLATVLYGVPTSGAGLPDLSTAGVSEWGQTTAPTYAAAVFGADKPVATLDPSQVAPGDWSYASVFATDDRGYTTNTATFGGGGWLPTWTQYNDDGYVTRELDAGDIAAVRAGEAAAAQAGTLYVYNTANNGPAQTLAGTMVTDSYGTARWVVLDNGDHVLARPHTAYVYDENSPNSGINPDTGHGWGLVTTTRSNPVAPDTLAPLEAPTVSKTGYGTTIADWKLGFPTTHTQVMGGGAADIVTRTGYDAEGRVVSQEQPNSNGNDAGTRATVYYTVAANSTYAQCGGKPQAAGLVCLTTYAGQASGQDLVTTEHGDFNAYLAPATVTEIANGATRTTTTTFDAAGRPIKSQTSATGLTGSLPVDGTETVYSAATGLPTQQWATNASGARVGNPIESGYDAWGRPTRYTPAPGEVTTTTYDDAGRVAAITDPQGTTSYGYGDDAAGNPERRGVPTSLTVTGGPGGSLTTTGAYNADGTLVLEKAPGGITKRIDVDLAGAQVGLTYSGQVTTDNGDGTSTVEPDEGWLGWSLDNDYTGRVRQEWTPSGAGFTAGGLEAGAAAPYDRAYTYDNAGRLTRVEDQTAGVGAGSDETTGEPIGAACETRAYSFDDNGNRTALTRTPGNADGSCNDPGAAGSTTRTWAYDAGDRLTGGYVYDAFGRQTTLPAADAPTGSAAGDVTLGYFDSDAVASITQNGTTTTFGLDQAGRRLTEATDPTGQNATTTTTRHYTDESDNPAWVVTTGSDAGTTRYAKTLSGDLGLTLHTPSGGSPAAELTVADPHGDIVTTIDLPTSSPATGITGWVDHDEYGNPQTRTGTTDGVTKGLAYGWHGAQQRAATDSGLLLMGARLYNPATGQFTSVDPVHGGNLTDYTYPIDPINQLDVTGAWCILQVGTTCTRFVKDRYGRTIPIRPGARKKAKDHGINFDALKQAISFAHQTEAQGSAVIMFRRAHEIACNIFTGDCWRTGRSVRIKMVIDFRTLSHDGKTKGLVTAHCVRRGRRIDVCPGYVNRLWN